MATDRVENGRRTPALAKFKIEPRANVLWPCKMNSIEFLACAIWVEYFLNLTDKMPFANRQLTPRRAIVSFDPKVHLLHHTI